MLGLNKHNHKNPPKTDVEPFRKMSLETLQHLSQFCGSVAGMAEFIKEHLPETHELLGDPKNAEVRVRNTDTIQISASGEMTLL